MSKCFIPLRYRINDWHSLTQCRSNTDANLKIIVTDIMNQNDICGTRITVWHPVYGELFSHVLNAAGSSVDTSYDTQLDISNAQLLNIFRKFGFRIEYNPVRTLSGEQISYLMTVKSLGFDKIRILAVRKHAEVTDSIRTHLVVFNCSKLPNWLYNKYEASEKEYLNALEDGCAVTLDNIKDAKTYDWSWLNFVANIDDVLQQNA